LSSIELDTLKRGEYLLPAAEKERITKILNRAMAKADGNLSLNDISLTEDNPEGRKSVASAASLFNFFVEQSSTIECNSQPSPPPQKKNRK
jgi:hypothetical protein